MKNYSLLLIALLVFFSCKKESLDANESKLVGTWYLSKIVTTYPYKADTSVLGYQSYPYVFNKNKKGTEGTGGQQKTFTWNLYNDAKAIDLEYSGYKATYVVVTFTEQELQMQTYKEDDSGHYYQNFYLEK